MCLEIALITKPSFTAHQYGFVIKIRKNLSNKKKRTSGLRKVTLTMRL